MAASEGTVRDAIVRGLAEVIEGIANVQGVPGEEDVFEYAMFDGHEIPPLDPETVTFGERGLQFRLRSGELVLVDVRQVSGPS